MAFFRLVLLGAKFNKIYKKVKTEKDAALAISRGEKPKYGLKAKMNHLRINCKRKVLKCLTSMYLLRNTALDRFLYRLRKYGSFENYIVKSVLGFLTGYVLTYLLFSFLSIQLNVNLIIATSVCCVIGCILTLGLAFSEKVRCIVFLTLPQFFSKRGRQALIAYALILTMTGPTKNILNNMGIMSESLACGQEQLKSALRQILDVIKKPFVAIKDAIKAVVKAVKEIIKKIKDILIKIKRVIMAILDVIKAVFQFLGKILSICNKELGTPFERCSRVFETAVADCQASLGPFFGWACSIGYLLSTVCYIVKPFDLICMLVDFISNSIIGVVVRKVKIFIRHVKTMFYVRIKFSHSFHFQSNSSKSMKEVAEGIVGEVKTRTRGIVSVLQFFNCAASLFFLFLIYRVIDYRHKFLTKERFDNRFLTINMADIDLRRAAMDKETILPLNRRERKRYITTTSLRLIETERKQLSEGMSLLMSTALKIAIQMGLDYSLYWIMMLIRKYGKFQSKVQTPNIPTIHIAGNGLLADLLKGIVKSFQPLGIALEIDTVPCLPTPLPPDTDRYIQIASILLACLIFTIFEPYGLRWRHSILCYYYPKRAKERAIWLYNHILRSRSSFLKFARRQLRRKVLGTKKIAKVTCIEYLRSKTDNKCLLLFLGSDKQRACLFCGEIFRKSDKEDPIECQRPGCTAIYCKQCFEDLENVCTVCLAPIEYGDNSDMSEEKDSSDEEFTVTDFDSGEEDDDSGRSTEEEGSSTDDYSYGYQEIEKQPSDITDFQTQSDRDLEKQHIPDYASMQTYDDDTDYDEESDEDVTDQPLSDESGRSFSSATSFRKAKAEHKRSLRRRLKRECSCLTLNELSDLTAGLASNEGNKRAPTDRSDYTKTGSLKTMRSDNDSNGEEEDLLMEFSSDDESSKETTMLEAENKSSMETYDSKIKIRSPRESRKLLSDSELSDEDVAELTGKPHQKFNKSATANIVKSHNEGNERSSPKYSQSPRSDEYTPILSSPVTTDEHSSRETTGQQSSPSFGDNDESKLVPESDSSVTELKHPVNTSGRRDSFRHIEFVGIDKPKVKNPSQKTPEIDSHQEQGTDKIYHSTIATKTSIDDVSSRAKKRKTILKTNSDSSVISEVVHVPKNITIPKLNLGSLVGNSTPRETEKPTKELGNKRKFDVNYKIESETPRRKKKVNNRRKPRANRRLKGGGHFSEEDSDISIFYTKECLSDPAQSVESSGNHSTELEYFSSPTYPFKCEFPISPSSSQDIVSTFESLKLRQAARFFETSDSSITLKYSDSQFPEQSKSSYSSGSRKRHTGSIYQYTSSSMTTKNLSNKSQPNKTGRNVKSDVNTSDKNVVRITASSEETKRKPESDAQTDTDASSEISISAQENILGVPRRKKRGKQVQKPEHVTEQKFSDLSKKSEEKKKRSTNLSNDEAEKQEVTKKLETPKKQRTNINDKKVKKRDEGDKISVKNKGSTTNDANEEKESEIKDTPRKTLLPSKERNTKSRDKRNEENRDDETVPILEEKASKASPEEETDEEYISDNTDSKTDSAQEKISTTLLVTPRASTMSKEQVNQPRSIRTSSPRGAALVRNCRKMYELEDENECGCCVCRHRVPKIQQYSIGDQICAHPCIDSCTQTNFDLSQRCCQIDREPDTVHYRCRNKQCSCQRKPKEDMRCFCPRIQLNEQCFCEVCTRLLENQDRHMIEEREICFKNPRISSQRNTVLPDYPSPSIEYYGCTKKTVGTVCKPRMKDQSSFVKQHSQRNTCRVSFPEEESDVSLYSDSGRYRDIVDLPYQDNDEYTRLVRELEERLVARNRERVRRTIKQFEECSSRNQNLRKPILYDGSSCGEEPILSELAHLKSGDCNTRSFDGASRPPLVSCMKNQGRGMKTVESMARYLDPNQSERLQRYPRVKDITDPTRWHLDNRTGEWCRSSTGNMEEAFDYYGSERVCTSPEVSPRRRMLFRYDDESRCEECDELNRRYGHRFHILGCPRHRSDNAPRHRKV